MKHAILSLLIILGCAAAASAGERADTTAARPPHRLRPLEVLGLKQAPDAMGAEAVTRLSGAQARVDGIESAHEVGLVAPNFYMPDYGSRMTSSIYVRGLGARMDQPVVGLKVDNVPVLNKDAYDFDIPEIESIEIIRGAQAILNGRNTMGGQINIRTYSPLSTKGLRASASYGNGNTVAASAAYYRPFSARLGMSVAAQYRHTDGFFRNEHTGKLLDDENSGSVRWKTAWRPTEALSLTNTASFAAARQGGYPYAWAETGEIAYNDTCSYRRNQFADGLTVAWAGKRVVVTSVTSVQYLDDDMHLDQDFLTESYFTLRQKRHEWTFTEDLFTRGSRGRYSWLGGVFAFYKDTDMKAPVTFKDAGISRLIEEHRNTFNPSYPIAWDSRTFTLGSDFTMRSGGIAFYHESTLHAGDFRFEAGLRLDYEHNSLDYISHCNTGYTTYHILPDGQREVYSHTPVIINDGDGLSKHFIEFLPKFTVAYEYESFSPYFNFSKGYKAGGFNTQMFSDVLQGRVMSLMGIASPYTLEQIVSYEPERSFNYELGFHSRLAKLNLDLDGVLFYIDCRNQQLTTFPAGTTTGRVMTNAARTRSFGAELTAQWDATADLSLRASYGYTHAVFRRYYDGRADYRGKRLPYAPSNTLYAEAVYRATPLTFREVTPSLAVSVRGAGNIMWNEANTESQDFYATLGMSLTFTAPKGSLQLWARNLTDTRYDTFRFVSMGNSFTQRALPRTYGATLRIRIQ